MEQSTETTVLVQPVNARRYHERLIHIHYSDDDLPRFQTEEEHAKFLQAVGRMVMYGMYSNDREEVFELVTGGFTKNPLELDLCYWPKLPARINDNIPFGDNATVKCNNLTAALRELMPTGARPFVVGAVLHGDGHWGFHS